MVTGLSWMPQIDHAACTGCGDCVVRCPTQALGLISSLGPGGKEISKAVLMRPDLCTYCTACEDVCPTGAIELPFLIMACDFNDEAQEQNRKGFSNVEKY